MKIISFTVLITLLLFSGCSTVKVVMFDEIVRTPSSNVEIFTSPDRVEKSYKEIAVLSITEESYEKGIEKLKIKASEIGADAIILKENQVVTTSTTGAGFLKIHHKKNIIRAVAIEFR